MARYDFIPRLYLMLNWDASHIPNNRESNIIRHYLRETIREHMTDNTALERAAGDIKGWRWSITNTRSIGCA